MRSGSSLKLRFGFASARDQDGRFAGIQRDTASF